MPSLGHTVGSPRWGGDATGTGGALSSRRCVPPAGEVAVPYFTGRITDWVASEDEVAAAWPMVLLGLSR